MFHLSIFDEVAGNLRDDSYVATFSAEQVNYLNPKFLILADHSYGLFPQLDNYSTVQLTHGYSNKNNSYHHDHRRADYICVCSEFQKDEYLRYGVEPKKDFWITGYPPLDPLFRGDPAKLPSKLQAGARTILYAPTWNMELNSIEQISRQLPSIIHSLDAETNLIIKPHPVTETVSPEWMRQWREMAEHPRVYLEENTSSSIVPLMLASDMLITDVSAVMFQFLALNRPIFLFNTNHPGKQTCYSYTPDGPEWRFRDLGHQFENSAGLHHGLEGVYSGMDTKKETREKYIDLLYGGLTDGDAGSRVADNIRGII